MEFTRQPRQAGLKLSGESQFNHFPSGAAPAVYCPGVCAGLGGVHGTDVRAARLERSIRLDRLLAYDFQPVAAVGHFISLHHLAGFPVSFGTQQMEVTPGYSCRRLRGGGFDLRGCRGLSDPTPA